VREGDSNGEPLKMEEPKMHYATDKAVMPTDVSQILTAGLWDVTMVSQLAKLLLAPASRSHWDQ
jgi:hypothetical protein